MGGDLSAWLASAREFFGQAFPGRVCPLRVTVADADDPTAAMAYLVPLRRPDGVALALAVPAAAPDDGLPLLQPPPVRPVLLSARERAVLAAALAAPLDARRAQAALAAAKLLRDSGKVCQAVRCLLSRMARRRGLLTPPSGRLHVYAITPLGKASLAAP